MFDQELIKQIHLGKFRKQKELELALIVLAGKQNNEWLQLLNKHVDQLSETAIREVMSRVKDDEFSNLMTVFHSCPQRLKYCLVDEAGYRRREDWIDFLNQCLLRSDAELRIRALKALSRLPLVSMRHIYLDCAASEWWQERMMAARLFAVIQDRRLHSVLMLMRSDPNPWVRRQAVEALGAQEEEIGS